MGIHYVCTLPVPLSVPLVCDSIPVQNGIVRRAGKSIIQMLMQVHRITAAGLQLSSLFCCNARLNERAKDRAPSYDAFAAALVRHPL